MKIATIAHLFLCFQFVMGKDTDPLQKLNLQFFFCCCCCCFFPSLVFITDYVPSGKKKYIVMNEFNVEKSHMHVCTYVLSLPGYNMAYSTLARHCCETHGHASLLVPTKIYSALGEPSEHRMTG